jgi:thiamine transport system permease protein
MRRAPLPRRPPLGFWVAVAIAGLVASGFGTLFSVAGGASALLSICPYLTSVLRFALAQAALSTFLSVVLGSAIALALSRRRFPGRRLILAALGAAAVMPAIVLVFAIISVYGRSGWLLTALHAVGIGVEFRIFGWPGILLAHVFLNAPFVARVYLDALAAVPAEQWRLAETLGFSARQVFRHLDWPALKSELAGLASLVFLLCFTSFAIVLTLGGGFGRATLEVAIFQALNADLDFGRAAWLGLVQIAICAAFAALLFKVLTRAPAGRTVSMEVARPDTAGFALKAFDAVVLAVGFLLIGPPLASLAASIPFLPAVLDRDFSSALAASLTVAVLSATAACLMALALAYAARFERLIAHRPRAALGYDLLPALILAVPPFALTAGLFLILRRAGASTAAAAILLPLINALGALPFAYRLLSPAILTTGERYGRLADLLGLQGPARLRIVEWPLLRRPLAAAFAMAMALSFGDFGIVALFGGELRTLPYLLYERLGAYRLEEASALGLVLVAVAFSLAYAASRWSDAIR